MAKHTAEDIAKMMFGPRGTEFFIGISEEQKEELKKEIEGVAKRMNEKMQDVTVPSQKAPQLKCEEPQSAHGFLEEASAAMKQRAALRDAENGERTAAQIAKVFNAITGYELSEADAWMFLLVLKIVRSRNGRYNRDDYVDLSAYAGLLGECESKTRKQ